MPLAYIRFTTPAMAQEALAIEGVGTCEVLVGDGIHIKCAASTCTCYTRGIYVYVCMLHA